MSICRRFEFDALQALWKQLYLISSGQCGKLLHAGLTTGFSSRIHEYGKSNCDYSETLNYKTPNCNYSKIIHARRVITLGRQSPLQRLLLVVTNHESAKPPEVSRATHALPTSRSIPSLLFYPFPRRSNFQ